MNTVFECFVPMRDGIKLYTTVQLPEANGKFPIIVERNPYLPIKANLDELKIENTFSYAVITQQCRGTASSEGECNAFLHERNDGLDLLEWIRKQPFYNGEIYLSGASYSSSVHFSYLDTNPSDVKAAFLAVQDTNRYNICYRNGFFKSNLHGNWIMKMHKKNQLIERNYTIDSFRTMPLTNITKSIFNEYVPYIENVFLHPDADDDYWQTQEGGIEYKDSYLKCDIPILLVTSFYDIYTGGIFDMWEKMSEERRKNCALIVTPFDHSYNPDPQTLPTEYQDFKDGILREICPTLRYNWFDHFRKGDELSFTKTGKIIYYQLWNNKWIETNDLINGSKEKIFYLTEEKTLETSSSYMETGAITYTYNPYNPASFEGGVCYNFGGMKYQDPPNSRYDIISFLSNEFDKDTICEGKIELELHCCSTAEDTCFYVRLSLVRDGKTLSLRDDIDSLCRTDKNYIPGEEKVLKYTFVPHSFMLKKGDILRLDVSSSCVPHFQVHTNNKGLQSLQTNGKICRNTIFTGKSFIKIFTT